MRFLLLCVLPLAGPTGSWWTVQFTSVDTNLRGIAAVVHRSATILWATGSKGAILRSTDAGQTWTPVRIDDAGTLDFRGVQTFDGKAVYVMSSGDGGQSRIYKSADGG